MRFIYTTDTIPQVINKTIGIIYKNIKRKKSKYTIEINKLIDFYNKRKEDRERYREWSLKYQREYHRKKYWEFKRNESI